MQTDIGESITYEVKKDVAGRYFGFRKLIEDDKLALREGISRHSLILEKRISFELIRIYILLKDEDLIERFLTISGLNKQMFYDPYLTESATIRQRVFAGIRLRGFTQKGRYKNAVLDCYERLTIHVEQYRARFAELNDEQKMISEEIKIFYQKNDLSAIMGFLRSLDAVDNPLEGGMAPAMVDEMDDKLRISPPPAIDYYLPLMPPLTPLAEVKGELKRLSVLAFKRHKDDILAFLAAHRASEREVCRR
ncbi:MAG TPA: hypothetical protein ENK33_06285 [Desulfobacterales bacterium]|nr:hypothetical protein [Desulfobacterales bacterium]